VNKTIEETKVGIRTIAGTDWPVYDQIVQTGARKWTVIRELCNGIPRGAEDYSTETAAREAFAGRVRGARPRAGVAASVRLELRLTPAEHARWQARANAKGVTISEFVRNSVEGE